MKAVLQIKKICGTAFFDRLNGFEAKAVILK